MEPRGCNRWQSVANPTATKTPETSETVAVGCDRLPIAAPGKEGVDGSSPSEGSTKAPQTGAFSFTTSCSSSNVRWVWSRVWSLQSSGGS
jgi:hypothetical protein